MKKLAVLIGMLVMFTCGTSAWASIALNFDGTQALTADTIVTNQYASYGTNFINGNLSTQFTNLNFSSLTGLSTSLYTEFGTPTLWTDGYGTAGSNTGYVTSPVNYTPTSNFLGFNKSGTGILFDSLVNSLSFEIFRSGTTAGQSSVVTIALYNTSLSGGPLSTSTITAYNNQSWKLFDSTSITTSPFDLAVVYSGNRFLLDNLAVAPVPIPPAFFLFGSGLSGLFFLKRRRLTA